MTWYRSLVDTIGLPADGGSSAARIEKTQAMAPGFAAKPMNEQRRSGFDLPVGHLPRERTVT